jgi:biotin operon repressor
MYIKLRSLDQILPLINKGKNYKQIGNIVRKSESTIKKYVKTLRAHGITVEVRRGRKLPPLFPTPKRVYKKV